MKAYLDSGATTVVSEEVIQAIDEVYRTIYGNPSSMHRMGVEAEKLLKESKKIVAKAIRATADEIIFTSGGTESNNLAIQGFLNHTKNRKKHIITTVIEHPSVLSVFDVMETQGYEVTYLKVNKKGHIDLNELKSALTEETALVSIMYVNNEIGSIQPLQEISKIIKSHSQAVFHVDCVQAFGKLECHVKKHGIDLMTMSAHKIHGPMGVGALYIKKGLFIKPFAYGGSQEQRIRPGTENLPGIVGFSKAVEIASENIAKNYDHLTMIKNYFIEGVKNLEGSVINGDINGAPHILNVTFKRMRGEVLLHVLEGYEIYVSTGSACASKNKSYSHVLEAIGLDDVHKEGAIRFSFSKYTTKEMIDYTIEKLKVSIHELDQIIKGR